MDTDEILRSDSPEIDVRRQRYPYSVVWGPLGPLTCCCPCVGHMGIGDSEGKIHDFNGPYSIGVDNFMVGTVWRYAVIPGASADPRSWNAAIAKSDNLYATKMHNICCQNCHHHTADALTFSGMYFFLVFCLTCFTLWRPYALFDFQVARMAYYRHGFSAAMANAPGAMFKVVYNHLSW